MKFATLFVTTVVAVAISLAHGADADVNTNANLAPTGTVTLDNANTHAIHEVDMPTPDQALNAVKERELPSGVKLTGATEPIQMTTNKEGHHDITTLTNDKQEQYFGGAGLGLGLGWGGLGWGGWGSWGGWGGFGPYRFGYSCGGFGGWAYPLGFWNAFGAGIWGGGCGLGIPYGGLFYC